MFRVVVCLVGCHGVSELCGVRGVCWGLCSVCVCLGMYCVFCALCPVWCVMNGERVVSVVFCCVCESW